MGWWFYFIHRVSCAIRSDDWISIIEVCHGSERINEGCLREVDSEMVALILDAIKFHSKEVGHWAHKGDFVIESSGKFRLKGLFHFWAFGEVNAIINVYAYVEGRMIRDDVAMEDTRSMGAWSQAKLL